MMKLAFFVLGSVVCLYARRGGGSYGYGLAVAATFLLGLYAFS